MKWFAAFALSAFLSASSCLADEVILQDDFERSEENDAQEQVGEGWRTNSKSRAKGVKQVDLVEGAVHITKADVADHGVSLTHPVEFTDGVIEMRFKLGQGDDLGIDLADLEEKSVHAGHLFVVRITPKQLKIIDHKNGPMKLDIHERQKAKQATAEDKAIVAKYTNLTPLKLATDQWYNLRIEVAGDTITVAIDGKKAGEFTSSGFAHPTKKLLRIAVDKQAWIDDVAVVRK